MPYQRARNLDQLEQTHSNTPFIDHSRVLSKRLIISSSISATSWSYHKMLVSAAFVHMDVEKKKSQIFCLLGINHLPITTI